MSRLMVQVHRGPRLNLKITAHVSERPYEFIEHTADIAIRVNAPDLNTLFINAADAMFEIVAPQHTLQTSTPASFDLELSADSREDLFVGWLNELLSLSQAKELIFNEFQIHDLDETSLHATVTGYGTSHYQVETEIKAATYHDLRIAETEDGLIAEIIFDV